MCSRPAVQPCSGTAVQPCSGTAVQQCSGTAMQQCSGTAVQQRSGTAMQQCSGTAGSSAVGQQNSSAAMQQCTRTPTKSWSAIRGAVPGLACCSKPARAAPAPGGKAEQVLQLWLGMSAQGDSQVGAGRGIGCSCTRQTGAPSTGAPAPAQAAGKCSVETGFQQLAASNSSGELACPAFQHKLEKRGRAFDTSVAHASIQARYQSMDKGDRE